MLTQGCRFAGEIRDGTMSQIPNTLCRFSNWLSIRMLSVFICEEVAQLDDESNFKVLVTFPFCLIPLQICSTVE